MALIRSRGVHLESSLYHVNDGFFYTRYKAQNGTSYYRCAFSHRGCLSRGVLKFGRFHASSRHNHLPNPQHLEMEAERRRVVAEAVNLRHVTYADAWRSANPTFATLTLQRLQPSMARARHRAYPEEPQTVGALDNILRDERYRCLTSTSCFQASMYGGSQAGQDGCCAILMASEEGIDFAKIAPWVFAFSTPFSVQGNNGHQYYTLSLAWLIVREISQNAMTAALTLLRSKLVQWRFKSVLCRGEIESEAYKEIFAPVVVLSAFYDYVHALTQLSCITLREQIDMSTLDVISLCCALPIVPIDFISEAVSVVRMEARSLSVTRWQVINVILTYIENEWINHPEKGPKFSVAGQFERSTNAVEMILQHVQYNSARHNGSIYNFISKFPDISEASMEEPESACILAACSAYDDILSLFLPSGYIVAACEQTVHDIMVMKQGETGTRCQASSLSNEDNIIVLTRALATPMGSSYAAVLNLLRAASLHVKHILLQAYQRNE